MWRERGLTLVVVTHDSSVARRAQRIGVMQGGRLSVPGAIAYRQPPEDHQRAARVHPGGR
jgi:ABC-type lipoprotein export system ATPase subunit